MSHSTEDSGVRFNNSAASVAGSLGGVGLAIGVPWVVLAYGQALGHTVLTGLVVTGVLLGGLMGLTSAFFGLVMPEHVGGMLEGDSHRHHHHRAREPAPERTEPPADAA